MDQAKRQKFEGIWSFLCWVDFALDFATIWFGFYFTLLPAQVFQRSMVGREHLVNDLWNLSTDFVEKNSSLCIILWELTVKSDKFQQVKFFTQFWKTDFGTKSFFVTLLMFWKGKLFLQYFFWTNKKVSNKYWFKQDFLVKSKIMFYKPGIIRLLPINDPSTYIDRVPYFH